MVRKCLLTKTYDRSRSAPVNIEQHSGFRCNVLFSKSWISINFTTNYTAFWIRSGLRLEFYGLILILPWIFRACGKSARRRLRAPVRLVRQPTASRRQELVWMEDGTFRYLEPAKCGVRRGVRGCLWVLFPRARQVNAIVIAAKFHRRRRGVRAEHCDGQSAPRSGAKDQIGAREKDTVSFMPKIVVMALRPKYNRDMPTLQVQQAGAQWQAAVQRPRGRVKMFRGERVPT